MLKSGEGARWLPREATRKRVPGQQTSTAMAKERGWQADGEAAMEAWADFDVKESAQTRTPKHPQRNPLAARRLQARAWLGGLQMEMILAKNVYKDCGAWTTLLSYGREQNVRFMPINVNQQEADNFF